MYSTKKPDNIEEYESITVDDKIFYYKKEKAQTTPKKRYSDQFKDPAFKAKDTNRKLHMMMQFVQKHGNIEKITDKYKKCIGECISILQKEAEIDPSTIFNHFNLSKYGFDPSEYGVGEDVKEENPED